MIEIVTKRGDGRVSRWEIDQVCPRCGQPIAIADIDDNDGDEPKAECRECGMVWQGRVEE